MIVQKPEGILQETKEILQTLQAAGDLVWSWIVDAGELGIVLLLLFFYYF